MRIEITLKNPKQPLPIDQNYALASAIYTFLSNNKKYSDFIHNHGYEHTESNKIFKLYTYSSISGEGREQHGAEISFSGDTLIWTVSSPMNDFINIFMEGILEIGLLRIYNINLNILNIKTIHTPNITNQMTFSCLAPIIASQDNNYLTYDNENISQNLYCNLIKKYEIINKEKYIDQSPFKISFNTEYIQKRSGKIYKLINIKNTKLKGILCPFELNADPQLINIACDCGIGGKNSMGFGMIKPIKST